MRFRKFKFKLSNVIAITIIIISIIGLVSSIISIVKWKIDSNKTKDQIKEIQELVDIKEIVVEEKENNNNTKNEDIENLEQSEQIKDLPEINPYWDYMKTSLISVDFTELKKINSNTKGWIQVNGTNINYPFVQASNNKYYLSRSFDKSYNNSGWVFLDYRNSMETISKNTIIYAHGMTDTTMFGTLKNVLENSWLQDPNNHLVKLSTETDNSLWQVFSVYRIPTTSDYIQVNFVTSEEFKTLVNTLISRSVYDFNTQVNENDYILTLSTCYNNTDKIVLHAKLIRKEPR